MHKTQKFPENNFLFSCIAPERDSLSEEKLFISNPYKSRTSHHQSKPLVGGKFKIKFEFSFYMLGIVIVGTFKIFIEGGDIGL